MTENPWADVGRLDNGHVLLRLNTKSNSYEPVVIRSISTQIMDNLTRVYGVHLREGRRSYHANNYLVAVNYPEVSVNLTHPPDGKPRNKTLC
jgi:hypothetical protein